MANRRVFVTTRGSLTHGTIKWVPKRSESVMKKSVKFVGPSVLLSDDDIILIASGNGEVKYGVPSFIK
ncbi:hypothetical protein ACFSO0_19475 [Brevibacillus sp. GCM10020057]|uniref:hypothetical protein n=1 Tax=Brevibacillus sp. GCM10020057 TaxID=3317327 RepID=UPI003638602B